MIKISIFDMIDDYLKGTICLITYRVKEEANYDLVQQTDKGIKLLASSKEDWVHDTPEYLILARKSYEKNGPMDDEAYVKAVLRETFSEEDDCIASVRKLCPQDLIEIKTWAYVSTECIENLGVCLSGKIPEAPVLKEKRL